ncbi:MAG: N-acetylneuraminate synthase family protein [Chloroflexota bacterium]
MSVINIGARAIGEDYPCYIIAEAGVNHNGSLDLAKKLVDIAQEAGADAVKFQKRTVGDILIAEALNRPYTVPTALGPTYGEHREKLELSADEWAELSEHCQVSGIAMLASGWDKKSVDFLDELGIPAFKVASADLTNLPLLVHTAKKNKPVILSTGMSDLDEIDLAVETIRKFNDRLILLQCTSTYPADNEKIHLRVMATYRQRYGILIGYSGHERGLAPTEAAVALGANVIERHFTIDRTMVGPDHAASLEPDGLRRLIRNVRNIEKALGSPEKQIVEGEWGVRERLAKSVVAAVEIPAGTTLTIEMLTLKGPGTGIKPVSVPDLVGRVTQQTIGVDTILPKEALSWPTA